MRFYYTDILSKERKQVKINWFSYNLFDLILFMMIVIECLQGVEK